MNSTLQGLFGHFIVSSLLVALVVPFDVRAFTIEQGNKQKSLPQALDLWQPVSNSQLDSLRGGFVLPNGMIVNISIGKLVVNNGVEVYKSYFQSPDQQLSTNSGEISLTTELSEAMLHSVIQNDLDNQSIKVFNTINIDIKNISNDHLNLSNEGFFIRHVLPNIGN